jgi:hypothetical protein
VPGQDGRFDEDVAQAELVVVEERHAAGLHGNVGVDQGHAYVGHEVGTKDFDA